MSFDALSGSARKFIHSSYRILESIPKDIDSNHLTDEYRSFIVQQSELFRETLSGLNADINAIAESMDSSGDEAAANLDQEYDLICNLEQSWHICEVFLINPTKHISIEVARWLKVCLYVLSLSCMVN